MPPVVAAAVAVVGALGTVGTIALVVGVAAAGYAYYAAQKAKDLDQGTRASERKQMFRSANAPKQVVLGEVEASGPIVFAQEEGAPNDSGEGELINMVVPVAGHECTECQSIRVGEIQLEKVSATADSSYWRHRTGDTNHGEVWFYSRPEGSTSAPASLQGISQWDEDMVGRSQSFMHVKLRSSQDQWPGGIEDVVAKVQGASIYDPRTGHWAFSANPALQGLHYIRHYLLVPEKHILMDTFIQAANICDETVNRAGVVEPRYTCHPIFDEESDPQQVLGNIAACMAGEFIRSGGLWGARAGAYYGPGTRTLALSEVVGSLDIRVSQPLQDRVNTITGQYLDPDQGYNLTDFPPVTRQEYIDEDGRERLDDLSLEFVQSGTQAQALAWIELEKRRRGASVTGTFKLSAIDIVMSRVVKTDFPGVSGLEFRVVNWQLSPTGNGIRLELVEDHPDIWSGQPGRIVQPILPGELNSRDPRSVQPASNLTFILTPDKLNQHGVLGWQGNAASYDIYLLDGLDIVWQDNTVANQIPLTMPVADKAYTVEVVALNSFKVKSEAVSKTISLTLNAPVITATEIGTRDHWIEVSWPDTGADSYELELMTQAGVGVYRINVKGSPVRLGWFNPGNYRLQVRALLGITPSAWSDEISLQIDDLNGPVPVFMTEEQSPATTGGMLSFSDKDPRTERVEYECTGPGFVQSGDCPGTPVRMPAMLPAVYQFRARAQWRDVRSEWQTVTEQVAEILDTPSDLTFTVGDDPGLWGVLTWTGNVSHYRVTVTRTADNTRPVMTQVTSRQYQLPVLKVGEYQVEVVAIGRVEESEPATITLTLAPPPAPANLVFTPFDNEATSAGEVTWDTVGDSAGYQVRLCEGTTGNGEILVESKTTDNRWLIAALTPGSYEVEVATISQREGALSDWSSVAFNLVGLKTPEGLTHNETLIGSGIQLISQVVLTCNPVVGATHYEFEYQELGQGSWSGIQSGSALTATLNAVPPGNYTFRVRAVSGSRRSGYATKTFSVEGTERPPQALRNLRLHGQNGNKANLSWDLSPDPDVLTGGSIHVRHSHFIGNRASWDNAAQVTNRLPGNATLAEVPLLYGTYLVKPVNAAGYHSETASVAVSNMVGQVGYNRVLEREEPDTWPGDMNKAEIAPGGALTLSEGSMFLSIDVDDDVWLYCGTPIPVDTAKTYRGTFRVRQVEDDDNRRVYAGLATLDKNFNVISGGAGTHRYFITGGTTITTHDGWVEFEGVISGEGDAHNNFRAGTEYVRPMFIVNYPDGLGRAEIDYLRLYDDTDRQMVPNDDFSGGKTDWSLSVVGETVPDNAPGEVLLNPDSPYYIMHEAVDLGAVTTVRVTMEVDASVYLQDTIDDRTTRMDGWPRFDGVIPDDISLRYELSQTEDDPNANPVWSDWTPFIQGEFRGRAFRLRIALQGHAAGSAATINNLKLIADVQDRIEKASNLNASAAGLRVNYQTPFLDASPSIAITAHSLPESGRWTLTNKNHTGFDIQFLDGNSPIPASFDYQAIGYGEAQ